MAHQHVFQEALIAEQIDERDAGQQRGHQDRDRRHQPEEGLATHPAAVEGISEAEGDDDHQARADDADDGRVPDRPGERGRREIGDEIGKAGRHRRPQRGAPEHVGIELDPIRSAMELGGYEKGRRAIHAAQAVFHRAAEIEILEQAGQRQPAVGAGIELVGRDGAGFGIQLGDGLRRAEILTRRVAALDLEGGEIEAIDGDRFRQKDIKRSRERHQEIEHDDDHQAALDDIVAGDLRPERRTGGKSERSGAHLSLPWRRRARGRAAARSACPPPRRSPNAARR